jgi:ABC-type glycerol-3-phosphate transport system substrate-binding protein
MRKKVIGAGAALGVGMLMLSACAGGSGETAQDEDVQFLTIPARAGGCVTTWTEMGEAFEEETGIEVRVEEIGRDNYLQRVTTQLVSGSSNFDIVFLLHNYIPQFAKDGQLEPLSTFVDDVDELADRYLPVTVDNSYYEGDLYGLPYDVSTMHLFYRTDLIDAPPTTLEEYRAIAEENTRVLNPDSETEYGTTFQGKRGEAQPKEWYQYFWAFGGELVDEAGDPQVNSEAGVEALTWLVENAEEGVIPPNYSTFEFPETQTAFQQGVTSMMVQWINGYTQLGEDVAPEVHDDFGMAVVPGGAPYVQSWNMAINAKSTKKQAAFDFVDWVSENAPEEFGIYPCAVPPNRDFLEDPKTQEQFGQAAALLETLKVARTEPPIVEWPRVHEIVNTAISSALAGEKAPKVALDEANAEIESLLD